MSLYLTWSIIISQSRNPLLSNASSSKRHSPRSCETLIHCFPAILGTSLDHLAGVLTTDLSNLLGYHSDIILNHLPRHFYNDTIADSTLKILSTSSSEAMYTNAAIWKTHLNHISYIQVNLQSKWNCRTKYQQQWTHLKSLSRNRSLLAQMWCGCLSSR